jgi:hypothetical protein
MDFLRVIFPNGKNGLISVENTPEHGNYVASLQNKAIDRFAPAS